MKAVILAAALAVANAQCPFDSTCCFQAPGATFDLSDLNTPTGVMIKDYRNDTDPTNPWSYGYYFSLCNDMNPPSTKYTPSSMCNTTGYGPYIQSGSGAAFQVGLNVQACARLGDHARPPTNDASSQFYPDVFNPSHGFTVKYTGGDPCLLPNGTTIQRSMTINVRCANMRGLNPGAWADQVAEDTMCQYNAFIFDINACPLECPRTRPTYKTCSGLGVCDFDRSQGVSRCFCNAGSSGSDCKMLGDAGAPAPPSYGGNIAGGFFGGIFTGIAVVLAYFFYKSHKSGASFVDSIRIGGDGSGHTRLPAHDGGAAASWTGASMDAAYAQTSNTGYVAPDVGATGGDGPLLLA